MSYVKLVLLGLKLINFLIEEGKKRGYIKEGELAAIAELRRLQDARIDAAQRADTSELQHDPERDTNDRANRRPTPPSM